MLKTILSLSLLSIMCLSSPSANAQFSMGETAMVGQAVGTMTQNTLPIASTVTPPPVATNAPQIIQQPVQQVVQQTAPQRVTIAYYFDYNCAACRARDIQTGNLLKSLSNEPLVQVSYKPLTWFGPTSTLAAQWMLAAEKQGNFITLHHEIMAHKGAFNEAILTQIAQKAGLDVTRLKADAASESIHRQLQQNEEERNSLKVRGVPTVVVGSTIADNLDFNVIKQMVASESAKASTISAPAATPVTQASAPVLAPPVETPQPPSVLAAINGKSNNAAQSLFFTANQLASIMRANQGFIAPREAFDPTNQSDRPSDGGPRILTLAGIVYNGAKDWTIWFNDTRVTPKNIPDRIVGLSVKKDRIHLRWMDIGNQRIVNLTLRPNQSYLLDSDTIVPAN
jgi:protein-disulfide isomerase